MMDISLMIVKLGLVQDHGVGDGSVKGPKLIKGGPKVTPQSWLHKQ